MTSTKVSVLCLIAIGLCFSAVRVVRADSTSTSTSTSSSTSTSTSTSTSSSTENMGGPGNPEPQGPIEPNAAECVGEFCDPEPEVRAKITEPAGE
ncbi:putative uncharacterized protein DDB_G0283467 [Haliotis rufescens]|uniref:putative uncharacterized protein DDB_G0283467 n=1 Tax=Haliotis rufescens TaxID=6454 RepID=UPI00201FB203|nr:putative uncharacterized protein DDB_G0283467 [Haliotis rufescens]